MTINERFSELRHRLKLTKDALAEVCDTTGTTIGNIETGRTKSLSSEMLAAIATKLNVNLEWLLLGQGPMLKGQQPEGAGLHSGAATVAESETVLKLAVAEAKLEAAQTQIADKDKQIAESFKLLDRLWAMIPAAVGKLLSNSDAALQSILNSGSREAAVMQVGS